MKAGTILTRRQAIWLRCHKPSKGEITGKSETQAWSRHRSYLFSVFFFTLALNLASLISTTDCCDVYLEEQKYPEELTVDTQLKSSDPDCLNYSVEINCFLVIYITACLEALGSLKL